jgi:hypothetical protein
MSITMKSKKYMARPERFELRPLCFEGWGFENLNALLSVAYGLNLF